jgi:ketosteroid isomerase-like protein
MTHEEHARRFAIGFACIALLGATPATADDVRAEIEAANKVWEAAAGRGDGPAVAALYTENGQLLPPQSDVVAGTDAIGAFWQAVFDSGVKGVSLMTSEVESHGDTAHEVGTLELRDADGRVLDQGKYIVIWKKVGTSWKLHHDIWNTSLAPKRE